MPPIIKKSVKRLDCTLWWTIFACFGVSPLDGNFKALIPTSVDGYSLTVLYQKWKKPWKGPISIPYNYIRQEHREGLF